MIHMLTHAKVGAYNYAQNPKGGYALGTNNYRVSWHVSPPNSTFKNNYLAGLEEEEISV